MTPNVYMGIIGAIIIWGISIHVAIWMAAYRILDELKKSTRQTTAEPSPRQPTESASPAETDSDQTPCSHLAKPQPHPEPPANSR